jgi:hypothetical protein
MSKDRHKKIVKKYQYNSEKSERKRKEKEKIPFETNCRTHHYTLYLL